MKKVIILLAIAVLVIAGLKYARRDAGRPTAEMGDHFAERMIALGVADIGQPIEGFDSGLLELAYPGLEPSDFEGVETVEGKYKVNGDQIELIRNADSPVSSAERMVSKDGYRTLLGNIASRLSVSVPDAASVDALISRINTAENIQTKIGQGAKFLGVEVIPLEVLEDSRCPDGVECVREGFVRVRTRLISAIGEAEETFTLNSPITTEGEEVTLVRIEPSVQKGFKIKPADYVFYFRISQRSL